jgi:aspartate dehydrogenase
MRRVRIGIIGFGFIGSELHRLLAAGVDEHLELAFVHARNASRLAGVAPEFVCRNLLDFHTFSPDLVVECAHPEITVEFGASFLECADYMPLSVTALAREDVLNSLNESTRKSHCRLFIPSGALVGTDSLYAWRHMWRDVTITFRKHPRNIDFALTGISPASILSETVIYDGPVRGIAPLFPRNVNTMVTCALATIGVDRCRGRLIADPSLNEAIAEVEAWGTDGSYLSSVKRQPAIGVSGTEMFQSTLRSIRKAAGVWAPTDFV